MWLKIRENLRTASLNSKFTDSDKKRVVQINNTLSLYLARNCSEHDFTI